MDSDKFTWVPFYKELAAALLSYKDDRTELVKWIYEDLGQVKSVGGNSLTNYLHMEDGSPIEDIDPFSVYGIFNRTMSWENRIRLLEKFKRHFNLKSELPQEFNGVPTIFAMKSFFFHWIKDEKYDKIISAQWNLYEKVVKGEDMSMEFNKVLEFGMAKYSLTMCLYWINPDKYLALDSRNREFLKKYGLKGDFSIFDYSIYSDFLNQVTTKMENGEIPFKSFKEISYSAWKNTSESEHEKSPKEESKPVHSDSTHQYWWLVANPKIWSLSNLNIGEEQAYRLFNDEGHKRRIFQNFLDAKEGDIVIGYESTPTLQIVALLEVSKATDGKTIIFKKTETLLTPIDYSTIKNIPELVGMEYLKNQQGSFFKLTADEFDIIMEIIREENPTHPAAPLEKYTKEDFLRDVFVTEDDFETLKSLLLRKKNLILQGAPGVGKTYAAIRLAQAIMGEIDNSRIEQVQFHQNYCYEDFMMGFKPNDNGGFDMRTGIFYNFCKRAAADKDNHYFFIIDEINRGNLSKIFGELLMLIENDYRDHTIKLSYRDERFSVPKNLHIIGMMNTADRSLAMIDYALRRRFSFFEMKPGFESKGFESYMEAFGSPQLEKVIDAIVELNKEITRDLGSGFCIGHSYFCKLGEVNNDLLKEINEIVEYEIIPMLREYWFDNDNKFREEADKLKEALK